MYACNGEGRTFERRGGEGLGARAGREVVEVLLLELHLVFVGGFDVVVL
jgi:hypothetical protein